MWINFIRIAFKIQKSKIHFFLKLKFNCKSSNCIYVVISCSSLKECIGQTGTLLNGKVCNSKHYIYDLHWEKLKLEYGIQTCRKKSKKYFCFFKLRKKKKTLKEACKDYVIFHCHAILHNLFFRNITSYT